MATFLKVLKRTNRTPQVVLAVENKSDTFSWPGGEVPPNVDVFPPELDAEDVSGAEPGQVLL